MSVYTYNISQEPEKLSQEPEKLSQAPAKLSQQPAKLRPIGTPSASIALAPWYVWRALATWYGCSDSATLVCAGDVVAVGFQAAVGLSIVCHPDDMDLIVINDLLDEIVHVFLECNYTYNRDPYEIRLKCVCTTWMKQNETNKSEISSAEAGGVDFFGQGCPAGKFGENLRSTQSPNIAGT